jgi:aspartyl-tRNA(Asn)/glutamyl-tRNA(Gln) amidotransferase subunit A
VVSATEGDGLGSLAEAAAAARAGQVSPSELVDRARTRVEGLGSRLNCHRTLLFDEAFERARWLETLSASDRAKLSLFGVPVSVKDCIATAGIPTSIGSPIFRDSRPLENAHVVDRLTAAGAIIVAKDNMYDFAYCGPNPAFGDAVNPWSETQTTGGSSSGSASAVAAEVSYAALGTDGGGSIRIPSSYCGVVGLKPTYDGVSGVGELPLQGSLSCIGPIARRVEDVTLLFRALRERSRPDDAEQHGLQGLVIGVPPNLGALDPDVASCFERACRVLTDGGASLRPTSPLRFAEGRSAMWVITGVEYAEALRPILRGRADQLHPLTRALLERAEYIPATEYVHAQRARSAICKEMAMIMSDIDVLVLPTVPTGAYERPAAIESPDQAADHPVNLSTLFTALFNVTGQPAVTVPCGFTHEGLPLGLQVVARPYAEEMALRVAQAYEDATSWHQEHPPLSMHSLEVGLTSPPAVP